MLTISTTAKPFKYKIKINQINAIRSWKALSPDIEIFLFGNGHGYKEVSEKYGLKHFPNVETSELGTPLHNSMFFLTQSFAKNELQAFVSCDIILLDDFIESIKRIKLDQFLLVGQRWDIDLNQEIDFDNNEWKLSLKKYVMENGILHPPFGSDYFVYRGPVWNNLSPVIVGRGYEDNQLIYHCRSTGIPVIDGSETIFAIHQNHDHSHHSDGKEGVYEGNEAQLNRLAFKDIGVTFTTIDANWKLTFNGIKRNYCRGNYGRYIKILGSLNKKNFFGWLIEKLFNVYLSLKSILFSHRQTINKVTK